MSHKLFTLCVLAAAFAIGLLVPALTPADAYAQEPGQCPLPTYTGNQWADAAAQAQYNVCYNSYAAQNYASQQAQWGYNNAADQWNQAGSNVQQWSGEIQRGTQWVDNRRQDVRNSGYFGR